jgi:hypothetical protein
MLRGVDEMKIVALGDRERRQHDDAHARPEEATVDRNTGLEREARGPGLRRGVMTFMFADDAGERNDARACGKEQGREQQQPRYKLPESIVVGDGENVSADQSANEAHDTQRREAPDIGHKLTSIGPGTRKIGGRDCHSTRRIGDDGRKTRGDESGEGEERAATRNRIDEASRKT